MGVSGYQNTIGTGTGERDITRLNGEFAFKVSGLNMVGEYYTEESEPLTGPSLDTDGFYYQLGYLFPNNKLELAGRYGVISPDVAVDSDQIETRLGLNYYFSKTHEYKLQADYGQLEDEAETTRTRRPASSSSSGSKRFSGWVEAARGPGGLATSSSRQDRMERLLDQELDRTRQDLLRMGGLVEQMIGDAMRALLERDTDLARGVVMADEGIDRLEKAIDEECHSILARLQADRRGPAPPGVRDEDEQGSGAHGRLAVNIARASKILNADRRSSPTSTCRGWPARKADGGASLDALPHKDARASHRDRWRATTRSTPLPAFRES